jgi:uroporphyrin-III C-methyltransferase/precorrin-2 dehydrogenase/sirohydrochlorin ferrochelatase
MHSLPIFVRLTGMRVLLIGTGAAAEAKARLIEAAGGIVVRDLPARIAFVALDDAAAAEAEATRLRAHGLLDNVVDRPALCDFTVPAIVDRSPVIVAVGTGGASASLAKALRERFEALLPAGLGGLAAAIFAARAAVAVTHPTIDARRRLWDTALAPGGSLDPLADHADAPAAVAAIGYADPARALTEILLTSPDPDDLTLKQLRLLNQADTIYHDAGVPAAILDRARRDAVSVAGQPPQQHPVGRSVVVRMPG